MGTHHTPTVDEGAVIVNSVTPLILHEDVEVWEIDCRSKYAVISEAGVTVDDEIGYPSFSLIATNETRNINPDASGFTTIRFTPRSKGQHWGMAADGGRYTFIVTLFRQPAPDDDTLLDHAWTSTDRNEDTA